MNWNDEGLLRSIVRLLHGGELDPLTARDDKQSQLSGYKIGAVGRSVSCHVDLPCAG